MSPQGQCAHPTTSERALVDACFTAEELARLSALRQLVQIVADPRDFALGLRRLEFARWLVQHGMLTEG